MYYGFGWTPAVAAIATRRTASGERCTFLRGTIGRKVSCEIYRTRPEVCRAFEPGDEDCLEARKLMGIEVAVEPKVKAS